jgi:hypothetical protein
VAAFGRLRGGAAFVMVAASFPENGGWREWHSDFAQVLLGKLFAQSMLSQIIN